MEQRKGAETPSVEWRVPEGEGDRPATLSTGESASPDSDFKECAFSYDAPEVVKNSTDADFPCREEAFSVGAAPFVTAGSNGDTCSRAQALVQEVTSPNGIVARRIVDGMDAFQGPVDRSGGGPAAAGRDIRATTRIPILTPDRDPRTWAGRMVRRHPGHPGGTRPPSSSTASPRRAGAVSPSGGWSGETSLGGRRSRRSSSDAPAAGPRTGNAPRAMAARRNLAVGAVRAATVRSSRWGRPPGHRGSRQAGPLWLATAPAN